MRSTKYAKVSHCFFLILLVAWVYSMYWRWNIYIGLDFVSFKDKKKKNATSSSSSSTNPRSVTLHKNNIYPLQVILVHSCINLAMNSHLVLVFFGLSIPVIFVLCVQYIQIYTLNQLMLKNEMLSYTFRFGFEEFSLLRGFILDYTLTNARHINGIRAPTIKYTTCSFIHK